VVDEQDPHHAPLNGKSSQKIDPHNMTNIEEDIEVNVTAVHEEKAKDEIDEEIDYDDDFEEAEDDEEEYQGSAFRPTPSPSPPPPVVDQSNKVTFRPPSSQSMRAPSPPINSKEAAPAAADIKKALQSENERISRKSNNAAAEASSRGKKGIFQEYSSTMPKFNLGAGTSPGSKAQLARLKDLRELKIPDKRAVERIDLFVQRPQKDITLFLSGKSLKYCKLRTTSCQTGDDDVEIGVVTDDVWNDDKEMQFPTLNMGNEKKSTGGEAQLLPFLRRVLPLFESSMMETRRTDIGDMYGGAQDAKTVARCSLPESFVTGYIGAWPTISDVTIVPQWYGADHALAIYSWPEVPRPPPSVGSSLDAFMRPVRSLVGLHPIMLGSAADPLSSTRPARCLHSFCRLSSMTVVNGRPHLIVAGSEMGSLLVYDLRAKPRTPAELLGSSDVVGPEGRPPNPDPDIAHLEGPVWLPSAFSTDIFAISSSQKDMRLDMDDDALMSGGAQGGFGGGDLDSGVHSVEICCVRCSDVAGGGDSLIFAMDFMGVVSFWRALELASVGIKLALQGSLSLAQGPHMHVLGDFLSASYLCIHPQQQGQFVAISSAGVKQANRQRIGADFPRGLDLLRHPEEEDDGSFSLPGPFTTQPCGGAFNPFFPGLLLIAYAEGDLALFDSSLCVPVTHWGGAVAKAPSSLVSVAWSTRRPCVFFVKCGDTVDVWDLSEKTHVPVQSITLESEPPRPPQAGGTAPCSELSVGEDGRPVVSQGSTMQVLGLPASLTTPLETIPWQHSTEDRSLEEMLLPGYDKAQVFPSISRSRAVEVPKHCALERDVLRRIVAGINPMQAWV